MITTAHVYTTLFIHLGILLVATAYYTVGAALMPGFAGRAAERLARRPIQVLVVGLAATIPWMGVALALMARGGPIGLAGAILGLAWLLAGLVGGAGLAQRVGGLGSEPDGWRSVARGGFLVALTWALPLLGWFVALPLSLAAGVGSLLLNARAARPAPAPPPGPVAVC